MESHRGAAVLARKLASQKQEMIRVGRYLFECGFHAALAGNLSARLGNDRFLCTAHGAHKGSLSESDLIVCDMQGSLIEGEGRPTSELHMHLAAYRQRSDVGAVIHAHPPTATSFAAASIPLDTLMLPEMVVWLGPIALVPYATPGSEALAKRMQPYLRDHNGFLLENHGALSLGCDLWQAAQRMELIEQNAVISLGVYRLGKHPFQLSKPQMDELVALRKRLSEASS